jgi:alkaline phosphatase D
MALSRRRFALGALGALAAACTGRRSATSSSPASPPGSKGGSLGTSTEADDVALEPLPSPPAPGVAADPYALGVGSGDPVPDGVVLWTRLTAPSGDPAGLGALTLVWELAEADPETGAGSAAATDPAPGPAPATAPAARTDPGAGTEPGRAAGAGGAGANPEGDASIGADDAGFARLAATGTVVTGPEVAHSVHVEVGGLAPDRWYRYRFRLGPWTSPVGRTRTAPAADAPPGSLRLAVASCQDWQSGFYAAYRHLVADRPDLVVFCGDYIYEAGPLPGALRSHDTPEPTTLDGYRARYAQYHSDPALRAAHAVCPWVVTWDDHEVANGYAGLNGRPGPSSVPSAGAGPGPGPSAPSGTNPDTDPDPGEDFLERRAAAYRAWWEHMAVRGPAPSGPDLTVHRSLGWGRLARLIVLDGRQYRSERPCGDGLVATCDELAREDATMLGLDQEAWLAERLVEARAAGVVWTGLVNQTLLTEFVVPAAPGGAPQVYADGWDGYPAARRRLLEAAGRAGVANLVALTGDLHASVVGDLRLHGRTVGTEFLGPGITSPFPAARVGLFGLAPALLPQVVAADGRYRGYVLCQLDAERWRAEYRWLDGVDSPEAPLRPDAPAFVVEAGRPGARRLDASGR